MCDHLFIFFYKLSSYVHGSCNLPRSKQQRHPPGFAMGTQNVPPVRTVQHVVAPGNATSQAQQAVGEFVQMSCLDSKNHNSSSVPQQFHNMPQRRRGP